MSRLDRRSILGAAITAGMGVGAGLWALGGLGGPGPGRDAPAAVAPPVACVGVDEARCRDLAAIAVAAIDDPGIPKPIRVRVWGTIACGDTFDCPPHHLEGRHPAGTAVVTVSPNLEIWVNVTELDDPGSAPPDTRFDAWVTRSQER